ncbi:DUF4179 domain-containing protein [Paenibacillus sp. HW567]|uniref:DUF4179 domain-containing protein n=1 Tax=Paenibacillus sp. HW567 TaxID=1034769 RepID=UPI0003682A57|nr:DUF4179 domain-containing protein [Paenibacillus sp. HW567]
MNLQQLEQELEQLKDQKDEELPELVRFRMDATYQSLNDIAALPHSAFRRRSWLRRILIAAASVAAAVMLTIGLGFISPAMAQTLKQLPFMESVFRLAGDSGLKQASVAGVTSDTVQSVTYGGVTLSVSELMYDGSRLSLVLTKKEADSGNQSFAERWNARDRQLGIANNIDFYINGELANTAWGLSSGGEAAPDSLIVTALESPGLHVPEAFNFKMVVYLADIEQSFTFEFPVIKKTLQSVVLTPEAVQTFDHINLHIKRLELSGTTIRLITEVKGAPGQDIKELQEAIPDKYKATGFLNLLFELMNERGETAVMIGANGNGQVNTLSSSTSYEPFTVMPKSVVVKPYIISGDGSKKYIPELEMTIPVE